MGSLKIHDFLYLKYDPDLSQKLIISSFCQVLPRIFFIKICPLVLGYSKQTKKNKMMNTPPPSLLSLCLFQDTHLIRRNIFT